MDWTMQQGTPAVVSENKRIAVILPKGRRGEDLRATRELAKMIKLGSRQRAEDVDVVLACPKGACDLDSEFSEIKSLGIQVRPLEWKCVPKDPRAPAETSASGLPGDPGREVYALPSDGGNDFLDCDLWLFVTDRLDAPLLPGRPYGAVIFDYVQRYVPETFTYAEFVAQAKARIPFVREASFLMVTTAAARGDLIAYAGVPQRKISQIPVFYDSIEDSSGQRMSKDDYLIWAADAVCDVVLAQLKMGVASAYR
jgi:hypothetical protein